MRAIAADVIEDQPFAQRQIAQREIVGAEPAQDRIEQDRPGDREIGATRIQPRNLQPFLQVRGDQPLAQAMQRLGGQPPVAHFQRFIRRVRLHQHAAQAQDGA